MLALSLCGNKLGSAEIVVQEVTKFKNLRALWLNNNPVLKNWYACGYVEIVTHFEFAVNDDSLKITLSILVQ